MWGLCRASLLGQSFSRGTVTQEETGVDEERVAGCSPLSQGALQRGRFHSVVQICLSDSRWAVPTQIVYCCQENLWLSPPPHHP